LRRVGEGLVVDTRQIRDHREGVRFGDEELGMAGLQMRRHASRMARLIETVILETDRERAYVLRRVAHQRGDERGIDPAGQEAPERYIAEHLRIHDCPKTGLDNV